MTRPSKTTLASTRPRLVAGVLALGTILAGSVVAGCSGSGPRNTAAATELPVLALPETPTLAMGTVEGDPDYMFGNIVSVLRLPDGSVAVADEDATAISIYDAGGRFAHRFGGRGEGPGELKMLGRIYSHGSDSILALDVWNRAVSVFAVSGDFGRRVDALHLSGDSTFALDVWLHGRYWVDGGIEPAVRNRVRRALARLGQPTSPGHRFVRVARTGELWIREPSVSDEGTRRWTIVDTAGAPRALVDLPVRFEPQDIRGNEILGRRLGESDVGFVHEYSLRDTGERYPSPEWMSAAPVTMATEPPPDETEFLARIRSAIKSMAVSQEIHYSTHSTYTPLVDSLSWEPPEGIEVAFVEAHSRGWTGVFSHPAVDRICGLGYGSSTPPGWIPGMVICAPPLPPKEG
ncbi:MAG: hypothetical protein OEZ65_00205 [Gemmatimonadota bacterium]|nr:hypothetical protein [Gemmatimonadota bacterium]MDH5757974.1 hypothetical protein [Gemmatimonadota bacterium]